MVGFSQLLSIVGGKTFVNTVEKHYFCGMKTFCIRKYGRTELAQLYCPDITPAAAWRKLRQWIEAFPGLEESLAEHGYTRRCRSFTPAQVRLIVEALGEP